MNIQEQNLSLQEYESSQKEYELTPQAQANLSSILGAKLSDCKQVQLSMDNRKEGLQMIGKIVLEIAPGEQTIAEIRKLLQAMGHTRQSIDEALSSVTTVHTIPLQPLIKSITEVSQHLDQLSNSNSNRSTQTGDNSPVQQQKCCSWCRSKYKKS